MTYPEMIKEKCTLKEIDVLSVLKIHNFEEMLFLTSYGYIIGKPYANIDEQGKQEIQSSILLENVTIIHENQNSNFKDGTFYLYIDQIIGMWQIDRDSFLSQMQQVQAV